MLRFVLISLAIFLIFNIVAISQLIRIHPRRRRLVIAMAVICNLMWLFFPLLNARTDFSRAVRAILGPPWFAWLCFITIYCVYLLLLFITRVPQVPASRIFLWGTLIALVVGVYTALVPLDVERVPVVLDGLPTSLNGTRIALIADLHVGLFTRPSRLRQIFSTAASLSPDVVVLAGDMVDDDPFFTTKLLEGARSLPPSIPLIAILGNHEMYGAPREVIDRLRGSRIRLLVNEGMPLHGLWMAGLSDYAAQALELRPDFGAALSQRSGFPIVIAHQPRAFPEAVQRHLPLTLCAHSHGGQFGFRRLGWSLSGAFLPYHMGLYRRGASQLYVNTGTGYWLLPWRLGLPSEITLIELRPR
ncbi:MAG TPA: metallophosphoesterase [Thermoanaerobaculia bacterium]|nr:metallophosphoesterase [Thermoanaerobaculia bacterium]